MTWTNPTDVSTGQSLTALLWNNLLGAAGSLQYLYNRSTYSTLAVGNRSSAQSIPNNTNTIVTFNSATNSNYATVTTGTGVFTIQETGVYCLTVGLTFATNATGDRSTFMSINGTQQVLTIAQNSASGLGATQRMTASYLFSLNATDEVEFSVYQNSGGALNLNLMRCAIAKLG